MMFQNCRIAIVSKTMAIHPRMSSSFMAGSIGNGVVVKGSPVVVVVLINTFAMVGNYYYYAGLLLQAKQEE